MLRFVSPDRGRHLLFTERKLGEEERLEENHFRLFWPRTYAVGY